MSILLVPDNSSLQLENDGEEAELELQGYGVLADVVKKHEPLPSVLKLAETPVTPMPTPGPGADADLTDYEQPDDKLPLVQPELQHHDHSLSLIDEDAEEQRDDIEMEAVVPGSPAPELESEAQPTSTELPVVRLPISWCCVLIGLAGGRGSCTRPRWSALVSHAQCHRMYCCRDSPPR